MGHNDSSKARSRVQEKIIIVKYTVYTAVFTSLVFLATVMIVVSTPATRGFFNLGETMVYTTALVTLNPWISFIAGSTGSALADVFLGYSHYAPGTFVIKGVEALIAVFLVKVFSRLKKYNLLVFLALSILASALVLAYGLLFYSGYTELVIAGNTVKIYIPEYFWLIVSLLIAFFLIYMGVRVDPAIGFKILAIILAGIEMVTGYFLYQVFVLGYKPIVAATEIPVNLGQAVIGLAISLPISETLNKMGIKASVD